MFPDTVKNNLRNSGLFKAVFVRKALLSYSTFTVAPADISNLFRVDYCHSVRLARWVPAFADHVVVIIGIGSKEQMLRSYTGRVIALVQHLYSFWDRTAMDFPRETMGSSGAMVVIIPDSAVSVFIGVSCPRPALPGFVDLIPEPFKQWKPTAFVGTEAPRMISAPRMKRVSAALAEPCYFKSTQGVNLHDRFANWLGSFGVVSAARAATILA